MNKNQNRTNPNRWSAIETENMLEQDPESGVPFSLNPNQRESEENCSEMDEKNSKSINNMWDLTIEIK